MLRPAKCTVRLRTVTVLSARGFAAEAAGGNGSEITAPAPVMLDPEPVEVFPRKNTGVVQIVEFDAHGIIADRLQIHDPDMSASSDNRLVVRPVALHLGRRALDPEIFGREAEFFAVVERDLEPLGGALQAQFDWPGRLSHCARRRVAAACRGSRPRARCAPRRPA